MAPSASKFNHLYNNLSPNAEDVHLIAKDIMSRAGKRLGVLTPGSPEDSRLRSFFGVSVAVILDAWYRMVGAQNLLPKGGKVYHMLWALMFMKLYGSEASLCAHAGGIDPKTLRKWVWPFIFALSELEYYDVVSCTRVTSSRVHSL